MIVKYFTSKRPGTVFCIVNFMREMCPNTQRKSRIKVTAPVKNVFTIDAL